MKMWRHYSYVQCIGFIVFFAWCCFINFHYNLKSTHFKMLNLTCQIFPDTEVIQFTVLYYHTRTHLAYKPIQHYIHTLYQINVFTESHSYYIQLRPCKITLPLTRSDSIPCRITFWEGSLDKSVSAKIFMRSAHLNKIPYAIHWLDGTYRYIRTSS